MSIAPSGPAGGGTGNLAQRFQDAAAVFRRGEFTRAVDLCESILTAAPGHPDVLHLLAMANRRLGRVARAERCFRDSLAAKPNQPAALSNLGNLLRQSRRFDEADAAYAEAVRLQPGFTDAWYNRGLLALKQHRPGDAVGYLEQARQSGAKLNVELALVQALQQVGRVDDAKSLADDLAQRHPTDAQAVAAAARQHRQTGEQDGSGRAIARLEAALAHTSNRAHLHHELALVYAQDHELDRAVEHLENALAEQPLMIEAHRALNEIHWQRGDERFGKSYRDAIARVPNAGNLYHNHAAAELSAGNAEAAEAILENAIRVVGRDPFLLHGLAAQKLRRQAGDEDAAALLAEALSAQPDNIRFRIDMANHHIRAEQYARAEADLQHARTIEPWNQEVWAYLGVVWRLTGDARHDWLNDYDTLLQCHALPAPAGYSDTASFMAELAQFLPGLHTGGRQPLDQSVRGGTQTFEILFDNPHPLVKLLKHSVDTLLTEYLAPMPEDDSHPFYARLSRRTHYTGSWSVMLRSGGHHTNHVHPQGWLSCCNYIALPPLGDDNDGDRSGWIRFGETSMALGSREQVARAIRPEPGQCVFFPSYFWHGTYAFESSQARMTVPCDIDPG